MNCGAAMSKQFKALVLCGEGINCETETAYALKEAGFVVQVSTINELVAQSFSQSILERDFSLLALPGGFSYGVELGSGRVLAIKIKRALQLDLHAFASKGGLVIGICNGFQALIRTGLLPFRTIGNMQATLSNNESGHFECRWIRMEIQKGSKSIFMKDHEIVTYPIAHGEGRFFTDPETLTKVEKEKLVVFRYVDDTNKPTMKYPENPNGSLNSIAGITDPTGRILGLMPHPECFTRIEQHPNWRRGDVKAPPGLQLFKNMVDYAKQS